MLYIYNRNLDDHNNHEVHLTTCSRLPEPQNRVPISGFHSNCLSAIRQAKLETNSHNFDGCWYCSAPCHKS